MRPPHSAMGSLVRAASAAPTSTGVAAAGANSYNTTAASSHGDECTVDHHWWTDYSEVHFTNGITLMAMIVMVVFFEFCHHRVHHWFMTNTEIRYYHGSHYPALLNRLSNEFMFLGFLAFVIWVFKLAGVYNKIFETVTEDMLGPPNALVQFEVIEHIHMSLFIGMCIYFLVLFVTIYHVEAKTEKYSRFEYIIQQEIKAAANSIDITYTSTSQDQNQVDKCIQIGHFCFPFGTLGDQENRQMTEYRHVRRMFMDYMKENTHRLDLETFPVDFDFACYLQTSVQDYLADLIDALGKLGSNIVFVNIGLCFGYLFFGFILRRLIHMRFRRSDLRRTTSFMKFVAESISPYGEIFVVRFFQAMVLYSSFEIAEFVSTPAAYSSDYSNGALPLYGDWIIRGSYLLLETFLLRNIIPSLNLLLRLPPFIDQAELEMIKKIAHVKHEGFAALMMKAVEAYDRGDSEAAVAWEQQAEAEAVQGVLTRLASSGESVESIVASVESIVSPSPKPSKGPYSRGNSTVMGAKSETKEILTALVRRLSVKSGLGGSLPTSPNTGTRSPAQRPFPLPAGTWLAPDGEQDKSPHTVRRQSLQAVQEQDEDVVLAEQGSGLEKNEQGNVSGKNRVIMTSGAEPRVWHVPAPSQLFEDNCSVLSPTTLWQKYHNGQNENGHYQNGHNSHAHELLLSRAPVLTYGTRFIPSEHSATPLYPEVMHQHPTPPPMSVSSLHLQQSMSLSPGGMSGPLAEPHAYRTMGAGRYGLSPNVESIFEWRIPRAASGTGRYESEFDTVLTGEI